MKKIGLLVIFVLMTAVGSCKKYENISQSKSSVSIETFMFQSQNVLRFEAIAYDEIGYITHVDFIVNGKVIFTDISSPFGMNFNLEEEGTYLFQAVAYGSEGTFSSSKAKKIGIFPSFLKYDGVKAMNVAVPL